MTEKPSIDLSKIKDITVRAGENIKIALPIKGWPVPTASWQHGDQDIYKDDRNNIEVCFTISQHYRTNRPCIPLGSLNRVPASAGVKAEKSPLLGGR